MGGAVSCVQLQPDDLASGQHCRAVHHHTRAISVQGCVEWVSECRLIPAHRRVPLGLFDIQGDGQDQWQAQHPNALPAQISQVSNC